ncbi:MAG: hypothetical protein F9K19_21150 [Rhizobiaceae bacterium]|nr:MAG: hypothetical protein F9K19_21150 [Rhizobiaceae bacterium]
MHLLKVRMDRLRQWWKPGVLCIGDAAHAMSPIGGVGVNLAIQDAIAAANILAGPLREGTLTDARLHAVQKRRSFPTKATQKVQLMMRRRRKPEGGKPSSGLHAIHRPLSAPAASYRPSDWYGLSARDHSRMSDGLRVRTIRQLALRARPNAPTAA